MTDDKDTAHLLAAGADPHLTDPLDEPPAWDRERKRIPKALCEAINDHIDAGHGPTATAEYFGVARATVAKHADAIDYRGPCKQHAELDRSRCGYLREAFRAGKRRATLAEQFDVDPTTVTYHARGRCACEPGVPAVED